MLGNQKNTTDLRASNKEKSTKQKFFHFVDCKHGALGVPKLSSAFVLCVFYDQNDASHIRTHARATHNNLCKAIRLKISEQCDRMQFLQK